MTEQDKEWILTVAKVAIRALADVLGRDGAIAAHNFTVDLYRMERAKEGERS